MTHHLFTVALISSLCLHFTLTAQLQQLPLPITPSPYQSTALPGEAFPSFNVSSPTFQSFNTSTLGGYNPVPSTGTVLQQIYPVPAQPLAPATPVGGAPPPTSLVEAGLPLRIREVPMQRVLPPDVLAPGLATIKDGKWVISDFFYNLTGNIGVKVEILKPPHVEIPLDGEYIERIVRDILEGANITTEADDVPCGPPLPIFHVFIMAYSCQNRCVGFIVGQLFERGKPTRMELDINGIWQIITWERQTMVASNCEDFAMEVNRAVVEMTTSFAHRYTFYHPTEETPCFNVIEDSYLR